jgi:hypothetical protein
MQLDYTANMNADVNNAIADSVRQNRVVTVECATPELRDFVKSLSVDSVFLDDSSLDVWGIDDDGGEWRLRVTVL